MTDDNRVFPDDIFYMMSDAEIVTIRSLQATIAQQAAEIVELKSKVNNVKKAFDALPEFATNDEYLVFVDAIYFGAVR